MIEGAEIIAQKEIGIHPEEPLTYDWKEHGFKVTVPAGAIGEQGASHVNMYVQASLQGDFQFPDDLDLVSGVFCLSFSSPVKNVSKNVTICLQHCASVDEGDGANEDTSLSFYIAKDAPPYIFKPLPGGSFSKPGEATISVSHFCKIAVLGSRKKPRNYVICTYYIQKLLNVDEVHISVTKNIPLVIKVIWLDLALTTVSY